MERIYRSYMDYEKDYGDFEYVPDNADEGEVYVWRDFVEACLGNITYAEELIDRDLWAFPSTMIDEDINEGAIVFNAELGTLDFNEEECPEIEKCVYDKSFFDPASLLYA